MQHLRHNELYKITSAFCNGICPCILIDLVKYKELRRNTSSAYMIVMKRKKKPSKVRSRRHHPFKKCTTPAAPDN